MNLTILPTIALILPFIVFEATGQVAVIPRPSPNASISQRIGVTDVTITYCRPSAKDREVFGNLVPYDKVWRAGANEATTVTFNHPVKVGDNELPAGKYGLFMIPSKDKWVIIFNSVWDQWGAYNYDAQYDILRFDVIPETDEAVEMCTFSFNEITETSGIITLNWEKTLIKIPLETETHRNTLQEIEESVAASVKYWYTYSAAAQYHFYQRKEADKALEYINIAIALNAPNPSPWMLKSQILASQGKYSDAIEMAKDAIEVSKEHNFWFEVHENEENIKKWMKK